MKKKLESTFLNMTAVLVGVALVTGGILAFVNRKTAGSIALQKEKTLSEGIRKVMGGKLLNVVSSDTLKLHLEDKETIFVRHNVEDPKGNTLGAAVESSANGYGGMLKILVGFGPDGTICGYTVLDSNETPGLGAKADNWFQADGKGSIIGKKIQDKGLCVRKDGGEVDAITASTITSRAFLKAVNQAFESFKQGEKD
ncbi:MAG: RnfABCDGE type electron transport complex subunit G [Prevotella sp.]